MDQQAWVKEMMLKNDESEKNKDGFGQSKVQKPAADDKKKRLPLKIEIGNVNQSDLEDQNKLSRMELI